MHPVRAAFDPMLGLPTWQVERGFSSFITMEFGEPRIVVDHPRRRPMVIDGETHEITTRAAGVRGAWHLWIYRCEWRLSTEGIVLAHDGSPDDSIDAVLPIVQGQALDRVDVDPTDGSTIFLFDLGAMLETHPAPAGSAGDEPVEQWCFFQPSGEVLAVRSDGHHAITDADTAADERWEPLPADG